MQEGAGQLLVAPSTSAASTLAAVNTALASAAGAPGSTGTLVPATHSTARWASTAAAEFQYHRPIRLAAQSAVDQRTRE